MKKLGAIVIPLLLFVGLALAVHEVPADITYEPVVEDYKKPSIFGINMPDAGTLLKNGMQNGSPNKQ